MVDAKNVGSLLDLAGGFDSIYESISEVILSRIGDMKTKEVAELEGALYAEPGTLVGAYQNRKVPYGCFTDLRYSLVGDSRNCCDMSFMEDSDVRAYWERERKRNPIIGPEGAIGLEDYIILRFGDQFSEELDRRKTKVAIR